MSVLLRLDVTAFTYPGIGKIALRISGMDLGWGTG